MNENVFSRVVQCISISTRYPIELLTAEADLENDLGIDSVKRLEIVVAFEEEFGLQLSNRERDPSIRTIADITRWIEQMLAPASSHQTASPQHEDDPYNRVQSSDQPRLSGHELAVPNGLGPVVNGHSNGHANGHPTATNGSSVQPSNYRNEDQPHVANTRHSDVEPYSNTVEPYSFENGRSYQVDQSQQRPPSSPHFRLDDVRLPRDRSAGIAQAPPANGAANKSLSGKVALVTGSGRGVGRVIARLLASKGATVIVNSFHSREAGEQTTAEIISHGGSAVHIWGSITNPTHLNQMFSQIESQFGRLDILVCNASDGRIGSFMELTPDDWDRAFRTNVVGHHQCAVRASELMRAAGGGSIVTMSAVGSKGWVDGLGSQGVVKAAVETLTRYLACELAPFGIRANCVAGGPVYGDLLNKFPNARSVQNQWEANTPDGQLCNPLDLANAIAFLVSEEARGINGAVWVVDHGFSAVSAINSDRVGQREHALSSR